MSDLRWYNEAEIPEDVRAVMQDLLAEALREAARKDDPGDGFMHMLTPEQTIGPGMWDGGWKLQTSHLTDERVNSRPFVVVHAYSGSQTAKGSVSADVVRTVEDRRFVAQHRLSALLSQRERLDQAIATLRTELET